MTKYTIGGKKIKNCWKKTSFMPRGKSKVGFMNICKPKKTSSSVSNREITIDKEPRGYSFNIRKISNNHIIDSKNFKDKSDAIKHAKLYMKEHNTFISVD